METLAIRSVPAASCEGCQADHLPFGIFYPPQPFPASAPTRGLEQARSQAGKIFHRFLRTRINARNRPLRTGMQPRRIQHGGITGHVFRFHFQKTGQQPPVTLHRRVAAPYMHVKLLHIGKHLVQAVHIRLGSPYHAVHLPQLRAYPVAFPVPQGSHHAAHPGQGGGQAVRTGSPGQQIRSVQQGAPSSSQRRALAQEPSSRQNDSHRRRATCPDTSSWEAPCTRSITPS